MKTFNYIKKSVSSTKFNVKSNLTENLRYVKSRFDCSKVYEIKMNNPISYSCVINSLSFSYFPGPPVRNRRPVGSGGRRGPGPQGILLPLQRIPPSARRPRAILPIRTPLLGLLRRLRLHRSGKPSLGRPRQSGRLVGGGHF